MTDKDYKKLLKTVGDLVKENQTMKTRLNKLERLYKQEKSKVSRLRVLVSSMQQKISSLRTKQR